MKTIEGKTVYKCEHCGRISLSKNGMIRHETACKKNPSNWACCLDCKFLDVKTYRDEQDRTKTDYFYCEKKNLKMYHPKALRFTNKQKRDDIIGRCDAAMPSVKNGCTDFEHQYRDYSIYGE